MDDLVAWLRTQLDDDERVARRLVDLDGGEQWTVRYDTEIEGIGEMHSPAHAEHMARWDPARVLAEVDAKRRILDEHQRISLTYWPTPMCGICADPDATPVDDPMGSDGPWTPNAAYPCPTVRLLALPYAGRDGYREEWRP